MLMNTTTHNDKIKSTISKYGLSKSLDLIVGGKDTVKQSYINNPSSFLDQFNDLTQIEDCGRLYYVDKDNLSIFYCFTYNLSQLVYINYHRIWMFFEEIIGLSFDDIKDIIRKWLEETYNIKDRCILIYSNVL
jgi:hypothetical protein